MSRVPKAKKFSAAQELAMEEAELLSERSRLLRVGAAARLTDTDYYSATLRVVIEALTEAMGLENQASEKMRFARR